MSDLRTDIAAGYTDADGLVSSQPCSNTAENASNNGVMYTGEYMTLLALLKQPGGQDKVAVLSKCEVVPGLLARSPSNNRDLESVDDYYGALAGLYYTGQTFFGTDILKYGFKWKSPGCYDNLVVGAFQWDAFLWRQPQLIAMMYWAAGKQAPFLIRLYAAVIGIGIACIGAKQTDGADKWRLTWLLVKVASEKSWMCRQASKLWRNRLKSRWGSMAAVYSAYYGASHPFTTAMHQLGE